MLTSQKSMLIYPLTLNYCVCVFHVHMKFICVEKHRTMSSLHDVGFPSVLVQLIEEYAETYAVVIKPTMGNFIRKAIYSPPLYFGADGFLL